VKTVVLLFLLSNFLFADLKTQLYDMYKKRDYNQVCELGVNGINQYQNDEDYISVYAFSCLYSDNIDQIAVPITLLYRSKESRNNAAYLSTILMQKKLLLSSLVDKAKLSTYKLPSTDFLLSKVFDLYAESNFSKTFNDPINSRISYTLDITKTDTKNIIIIEEYYDRILTNRHLYH